VPFKGDRFRVFWAAKMAVHGIRVPNSGRRQPHACRFRSAHRALDFIKKALTAFEQQPTRATQALRQWPLASTTMTDAACKF
jgi:hypothetical protein